MTREGNEGEKWEMKVVIDTNILINAAGDESSYAFRIIREVIAGRLEAYATHQTMSENRQMLRKLVKDREYREMLEEFFRRLQIVKLTPSSSPPSFQEGEKGEGNLSPMIRARFALAKARRGRLRGGRPAVSDPEDAKLFESAVAAGADYLITEDQEVLYVEEYEGTKVVTPQDFWAKYKGGEDDSAWQDWARMLMRK